MDVLSTSYIIPGPNTVEVVMHCGKERGGRIGLVVAGLCYIFPAMLICLAFGYFYQRYSALPNVQNFIYGIRPATTALVIGTVFRLWDKTLKNNIILIVVCLLVFVGSLYGMNEVLLIIGAGIINYFAHTAKNKLPATPDERPYNFQLTNQNLNDPSHITAHLQTAQSRRTASNLQKSCNLVNAPKPTHHPDRKFC